MAEPVMPFRIRAKVKIPNTEGYTDVDYHELAHDAMEAAEFFLKECRRIKSVPMQFSVQPGL